MKHPTKMFVALETTGLGEKDKVWRLGIIVTVKDEVKDRRTFLLNPLPGEYTYFDYSYIEGQEVNTPEEILEYFCGVSQMFGRPTLVGFNISFFQTFIERLFKDDLDTFKGAINTLSLDLMQVVMMLEYSGILTGVYNFKLPTICKALGISGQITVENKVEFLKAVYFEAIGKILRNSYESN